ncbi:MAG: aminopeptidase N C-terminal domain-containing protein, partial [Pseudomonadota bacterium]|nr:aminopeptidase N C-terminal domain-containing protein [Pseudomonadota bacterium]
NLMRHDENEYNRWQAGQAWAMNILQANICACATDPEAFSDYADVLADVLENDSVDLAVRAEMLSLPSIQQVLEKQSVMNPTATHEALTSFEQYLGGRLEALLLKPLQVVEEEPYALDAQSIAKRQYRNRCLSLLVAALPQKYAEAVENLYAKANNLTDRLTALKLAVHHGHDKREGLLQDFYASWKEEALVIDHWFAVQASQPRDEVISMINSLLGHDAFEWTNPNRVRSVVASFCRLNLSQFYREDGKGLELLAQTIGTIDAKNPQLAARLAGFFNDWGKLDEPLRGFAEKQIEALIDKGLSENCYEILSKSLSWYRSQD